MPGTYRFVRYGAPAFEDLSTAVADRQADDPLAPVTVVVSTRTVGHTLRHLLAVRTPEGLANVRFVTLADLTEELGGVACRQKGRRKATRPLYLAAARMALSSGAGFLAPVADQPTTESELVSLYEDLRQVGDQGLAKLRSLGRRSSELAALLAAMRATLEPRSFDDADLVMAAAGQLRSGVTSSPLGDLLVHLPDRLRAGELEFLQALAERYRVVVHLGVVDDASGDAPIIRVAAALDGLGFACDDSLPASATSELGLDQPLDVGEVVGARDEQEEVRAAVRQVLAGLESGTAPDRIGLFYGSQRTYAATLKSTLDEAGIRWSGPSPSRVSEAPAARLLAGLCGFATDGLGRGAVMEWARSVPMQSREGLPLPLAAWELISRRAG